MQRSKEAQRLISMNIEFKTNTLCRFGASAGSVMCRRKHSEESAEGD